MSKLRKSAQGQTCTVRVPGYCTHDRGTVVLAHYRLSETCGVGMKPPDELGAYTCHPCHEVIDGRLKTSYTRDELRLWHAEGVLRTLYRRIRG